MQPSQESTDRKALDCAHFAVTWFGIIISIAGLLAGSLFVMGFGGMLVTFGLLYFIAQTFCCED